MEIDELYALADHQGIRVDCYPFAVCTSMSVMLGENCYIAIDPFKIHTHAEEKVKLAHEMGHCETGSFYNLHAPLDIRAKHEHRADAWAIKKLIPRDKLLSAFEAGYTEKWELAEHFGVTEDFMQKALEYYAP